MSPDEWDQTTDLVAQLIALRGEVDENPIRDSISIGSPAGTLARGAPRHTTPARLRAFGACCYARCRAAPLDDRSRMAIEAYGAFLTGASTYGEFREACRALGDEFLTDPHVRVAPLCAMWDDTPFGTCIFVQMLAAIWAEWVARDEVAELRRDATPNELLNRNIGGYPDVPRCRETAAALQGEFAELLRETVGNPFRPVAFAPFWRTDTAVVLARQMHEACDFSAMPILADALEDAGCENPDILAHCRDPERVHAHGCWVVALVLGKE
jgi:hypothetical protein